MKIDSKLQPWIDARTRHRLSHAHVQMARELAMNPTKLGKLDNHRQEPWKLPLPEFIEALYEKRFGRRRRVALFLARERASHPSRTVLAKVVCPTPRSAARERRIWRSSL